MKIRREYEYDDVMLLPRPSDVIHRDDVSLKTKLGNLELDLPIVASPMKWISTVDLITGLGELGGIGILHRFHDTIPERMADITDLSVSFAKYGVKFGVAIGLTERTNLEQLFYFSPSIVCIDIANGYLSSLCKRIEKIANFISENKLQIEIMAGNVVDLQGTNSLYDAGATIVRIGIGSGHLCTTRRNTGIGRPQLSAIEECSFSSVSIVADGGINSSGDIVKALAAGADAVMLGTMFSRCYESGHNGFISGMASRELQENFYGTVKSVEGITEEAVKDISLKDLITELSYNIRSGFTYLSASNIDSLRLNAEFVAIK